MSFSSKNYIKVRNAFEAKKLRAVAAAEEEALRLHTVYPELAALDRELSAAGLRVFAAAVEGGEGLGARIDDIKNENALLQEKRNDFLASHGLAPDADEPKYECPVCRDEGFVDGHMCECFRRALIDETFQSSGIGFLMQTQSFETFTTDYCRGDRRALETIQAVLLLCRDFAENFTPGNGRNLLLTGKTGLGKTHISTSIAKVVIERGCDVVYDTAQNIMSDFEYERFERDRRDSGEDRTERYFDCDLLIIDDLGTEMTNAFTVACLYNIINTRLNHRASMIINTNLSQTELRSRYDDRITSRLFGDFSPLLFLGRDVRSSKLLGD